MQEFQSDWAQSGREKGFKTNLLDVDLSYIEYRTQLWDKYNVDRVEDLRGKATNEELSTLNNLFNKEDGRDAVSLVP